MRMWLWRACLLSLVAVCLCVSKDECKLGPRASMEEYRIEGEKAGAAQDWARAAACFEEATSRLPKTSKKDDKHADMFGKLGHIYTQMKNSRKAMESLQKSIAKRNGFDATEHLHLAANAFDVGDYKVAEKAYKALVKDYGHVPEIHHNLGAAYVEQGKYEEAAECYKKALAVKPDFTESQINLANVQARLGNTGAGLPALADLLQKNPVKTSVYISVGHMLKQMELGREAMRTFQTALRIDPKNYLISYNVGTSYLDQLKYDEALYFFEKAERLPDGKTPLVYDGIGTVHQRRGKIIASADAYEKALSIDPTFSNTLFNYGCIFLESKDFEKAIHYFARAVQSDPQNFPSYFNMGLALKYSGRFAESIESYKRASEIKPTDGNLWNNLAGAYTAAHDYASATQCFINALSAGTSKDMKAAVEINLADIRAEVCDWSHRAEDEANLHRVMMEGEYLEKIQPFHILTLVTSPWALEHMDKITRIWAAEDRRQVTFYGHTFFTHGPSFPKNTIRLGYMSSDIWADHPTAQVMQTMLKYSDTKQFDIYYFSLRPDQKNRYLQKGNDPNRLIDLTVSSTAEAAAIINSMKMDILVDVNGHTQFTRHEILAFNPSPLSIHHLDFMATMGGLVDYYLVDPILAPPDFTPHYAEKLLYFHNSYHTGGYGDNHLTPPAERPYGARTKQGLPEDAFVFCSFNKLSKLDPWTFDTWMRIMRRVPNSVLWMFRSPIEAEEKLKANFKAAGFPPERLVLADRMDLKDHLERMRLGDLFLDNPMYSGGVTACDSMASGLPLLSLPRLTPTSRTAAGVQTSAGTARLGITRNLEDYEELAVQLANRPDVLKQTREFLISRRSSAPIFDDVTWIKTFERGLRLMYEVRVAGLDPHHLLATWMQ